MRSAHSPNPGQLRRSLSSSAYVSSSRKLEDEESRSTPALVFAGEDAWKVNAKNWPRLGVLHASPLCVSQRGAMHYLPQLDVEGGEQASYTSVHVGECFCVSVSERGGRGSGYRGESAALRILDFRALLPN
eukprot:scaffold245_cov256-Pinguiococcus_pyrenoidosus.AAC.41